jgi:hypothetical protein
MKEIPLSKGKVALVDDEDYEELSQWKWSYNGRVAMRGAFPDGRRKNIIMHRQIMNAPDGMEVDHIDHDPLNNSRSNLRICTRAENSRNRSPQRNGSSRFLGVSWDRQRQRWSAHIMMHGKLRRIGSFPIEEEAARAYDREAIVHHGPFANPNYPRESYA